jgi:thioredoxin reductase (NADPH)
MFDVIIVGGGPAGLTAAIYAARRVLKTLIIAKDPGGKANLAGKVENYPGILSAPGFEIMQKMKEQAEKSGAEFKSDEVKSISKDKDVFIVKTNSSEEKAKAIILAFGLAQRELGIPGEEKFKGRGVSYCAICDGPLYKNKIAAVVGGGNAAIDAAIYLGKLAKKVYLIHRREGFRAEELRVCKLKEIKNVELVLNSTVSEILGDDYVTAVRVSNVNTKAEREIRLDGIFIEIGYVSKADWLEGLVKLNERKEIVTDKDCKTSGFGIFAAGDITDVSFKQIIISAGEGAKAALSAYRYLNPISGGNGEAKTFDWGQCKRN